MAGKAMDAGWLHCLHIQETKTKQEVEPGYKFLKVLPTDTHILQ